MLDLQLVTLCKTGAWLLWLTASILSNTPRFQSVGLNKTYNLPCLEYGADIRCSSSIFSPISISRRLSINQLPEKVSLGSRKHIEERSGNASEYRPLDLSARVFRAHQLRQVARGLERGVLHVEIHRHRGPQKDDGSEKRQRPQELGPRSGLPEELAGGEGVDHEEEGGDGVVDGPEHGQADVRGELDIAGAAPTGGCGCCSPDGHANDLEDAQGELGN
jgi:hypothetical protein